MFILSRCMFFKNKNGNMLHFSRPMNNRNIVQDPGEDTSSIHGQGLSAAYNESDFLDLDSIVRYHFKSVHLRFH